VGVSNRGASNSAFVSEPTRELLISRVFDAPRRLVFKAWTEPERAAMWWGPQGFTTISCDMDVRPGGAWRKCMRSPDGFDYVKRGVYREVVPPARLVFTYISEDAKGDPVEDTLVTVTFVEIDGKTELTLHQTLFSSVAERDAHEWGWTSCLERFAGYIATERNREEQP
jgi:uncharacterized protein YndB with AHSA1/START domain